MVDRGEKGPLSPCPHVSGSHLCTWSEVVGFALKLQCQEWQSYPARRKSRAYHAVNWLCIVLLQHTPCRRSSTRKPLRARPSNSSGSGDEDAKGLLASYADPCASHYTERLPLLSGSRVRRFGSVVWWKL